MLDISELARPSGLSAATIRYYEEIGLIRSSGRRGLKRLFEKKVGTRLALISLGRTAGVSLSEIRGLVGTEGRPDLGRSTLSRQADRLDEQIKELTVFRDGIRHIAACSAENHLDCPRFKRIMRIALMRGP
ncbi:MerR family DNA-binding transcriptional regulator [Rhodovulum sulfidophilum]|uniref:MerR family transcriptional regulator n=1 Tax=Rhodovulum sulfidophilum TaxID=35806 RepID=A0ABS1RX66_RHOSU|nr:MerR family DNA-binding transcriptional regulator [Rhodovulum sulfidophilum]MBL3610698.1 MerR family transcriptional regulator [Rhodovulum sulfidophilum]MCE8457565.1 MerR family DNA-binding transcriptional regulator [Rhodovulum sulfidophilum]